MDKQVLNDFYNTLKLNASLCLYPGMSCKEIPINAHSIQNSKVFDLLSSDGQFCFIQRTLKLKGNETIVELGSGSGFQVEMFKKIFPDLTILCFDLPAPLYLCQQYLSNVLGDEQVVQSDKTMEVTDLNGFVEKGKVHMFGNWKFPLLKTFQFDLFWNAASFGEMEPDIVMNYLSYVKGNCAFVFLLQARHGKESTGSFGVVTPLKCSDYDSMLNGYAVIKESDAYEAHRSMSQSGGYFQAVWQKAAMS